MPYLNDYIFKVIQNSSTHSSINVRMKCQFSLYSKERASGGSKVKEKKDEGEGRGGEGEIGGEIYIRYAV